jgi:plastocyanin domain-containing protein
MRFAGHLAIALALFLPLAAVVSGDETKAGKHERTPKKEKRAAAKRSADVVQRIEIKVGEYYFNPKHIVVKVNKPVELTVTRAAGLVPHNLIVRAPEAGIDFKADLGENKSEIVKFTPTRIGSYRMICDKKLLWFKSHRERGMEGVIEVVK